MVGGICGKDIYDGHGKVIFLKLKHPHHPAFSNHPREYPALPPAFFYHMRIGPCWITKYYYLEYPLSVGVEIPYRTSCAHSFF